MKILQNIKKNTIILLIITIIVLYILLKDDFIQILDTFKNINIWYVLIAFLFYFLSIVLRGYVNYRITNDKEKLSLREAIKHNWIAQFFNGITPFSTGGQPMEVYMLTEHNISVANATNQTIQSFIFYQIALVICGIIAVIYNFIFHLFPKNDILQQLVLLGFMVNIAVVVALMLVSYSKRITNKISNIVIKIAKKLNINVNEESVKNKFDDYYYGFKKLKKRKSLTIVGIILNIISLICLYITPFFIVKSIRNIEELSFFKTITASAYVYVMGAFIPIPGASGGIEFGFTQFFGNLIGTKILSATLIIWRFITYYLGVIIGAIIFNFEKKVEK